MSPATIAATILPTADMPHTPHTAHPIPLREQAFTLHCQGLRSPAISAELGVPERTIRAWIAAALDDLKDDLQLSRKEQLLLAIERQHQLTATAWKQFERETAARDALLDAALRIILATAAAADVADVANDPGQSGNVSSRPLHLHLPASTPAPCSLSLILQATKEINRLLGLHTLAKLLLNADSPDFSATEAFPFAGCDIPAESATDTAAIHFAAESATAPSPRAADVVEAPCWIPAADNVEIPAESATAPAPAFQGHDSSIPAKSATAIPSDLVPHLVASSKHVPYAFEAGCSPQSPQTGDSPWQS